MNIFFTSDHHFHHANIIKFCNRPFKTVEEMDEAMVEKWNSVVKHGDVVYHLGDFCMGKPDVLPQLNGEILFVRGSHDKWMKGDYPYLREVGLPYRFHENGQRKVVVLCHYAMRSWSKSHFGSWHLFGHHHGKLEPYGLSFDVGVDTHDFAPYHLDEIETKMKELKPIVDYSKGMTE